MKKMSEKVRIIHEQFARYGRSAREWMRKCEMLLPHVEREHVWEKKGFTSIYHYAAVLAGMNRGKVDEALRVMKNIEDKPELIRVVEQKGVQAVRPVAAVASVKTAAFWAEKSMEMSKHTLEGYVQEWKKAEVKRKIEGAGQEGFLPGEDLEVELKISLSQETTVELQQLKGSGQWEDLIKEFLAMRREKLEQIKPQKVSGGSRPVPAKIEKYVRWRARGMCEAPRCGKKGECLHHIIPFALRREHDPDNIRLLCGRHHEIAHHGLIENEEQSPENWKLREHANSWELRSVIDERVMEYKKRT